MAKAFPQVQTNDPILSRIQDNLSSTLQPLLKSPLSDAAFLTGVSLSVGANSVSHGLGRKLTGWIITRMRSNFSQVYDTQDSNSSPEKFLLLNASAAVTVDLVVF